MECFKIKNISVFRRYFPRVDTTEKVIALTFDDGPIPPYGKKLFLLPYYLNQHNRKTIMWDVEPESYSEVANSSENITKYVLENTKPGSIILLHVMFESRKESVRSIEGIVQKPKKEEYY
jgi:chitin deacetylase